jgi:FkbH-like protein
MSETIFLKELSEFYNKKKSKKLTPVKINVISDVTFQPINKYLPFFLDKFRVNISFKIGDYDQLKFNLKKLNKKNHKNYDFTYIHSSLLKYFSRANSFNKTSFQEQFDRLLNEFFLTVKTAIEENSDINFIVNLFELPPYRICGTSSLFKGSIFTILDINNKILNLANKHDNLILHDANFISARIGLDNWYDFNSWAAFKQPYSGVALKIFSKSLASIIASKIGKSKKLLITDLDNTLWGGVIGDDGINEIHIGQDTSKGELYLLVQSYIKTLGENGVALSIVSKNELANAKLGFEHKYSILKYEDFVNKKINWNRKSENINSILKELNLGNESFVFIDDNPVEISEVKKSFQDAECLTFKKSPVEFLKLIDEEGFFEKQKINREDLFRNKTYKQNLNREKEIKNFSNYSDFLKSLKMKSEFFWNKSENIQRLSDLVNKTNQFNTSQKKISTNEVSKYISDDDKFLLSANLEDKYGASGIITVAFGKKKSNKMVVENWVMSCRVFNRSIELATLSVLSQKATEFDVKEIEIPLYVSDRNHYCRNYFKSSKLEKKLKNNVIIYTLNPKKKIKIHGSEVSIKIY